MSTRLTDLMPDVQDKAQQAIEALSNAGIPNTVTSTLRTEAEQMAFFAQGRDPLITVNALRSSAGMSPIFPYIGKDGKEHSDNDYTVTNADGVHYKSNHQSGRALDITPVNEDGNPIWPPYSDPRWKQIADIVKRFGFSWGGDWPRFPDMPHYEMV